MIGTEEFYPEDHEWLELQKLVIEGKRDVVKSRVKQWLEKSSCQHNMAFYVLKTSVRLKVVKKLINSIQSF